MGFSVILPTFNENNHIKDLIKSIANIFLSKNILFEIIVVDDNSTDGTIEVVKKIQLQNLNVKIFIRKNKKKSLVESLKDGIKYSKNYYVIWLDADYSHPPEYINEFIFNNDNYD